MARFTLLHLWSGAPPLALSPAPGSITCLGLWPLAFSCEPYIGHCDPSVSSSFSYWFVYVLGKLALGLTQHFQVTKDSSGEIQLKQSGSLLVWFTRCRCSQGSADRDWETPPGVSGWVTLVGISLGLSVSSEARKVKHCLRPAREGSGQASPVRRRGSDIWTLVMARLGFLLMIIQRQN